MTLLTATILVLTGSIGTTIQVGSTRTLKTIQAGLDAAADGDTIEIDAGDYPGTSVTITKSNLTLKGVGGRPQLSYSGDVPNEKGILVVGDPSVHDLVIDNLEISGAQTTVAGGMNAASIRFQGANLTVRNSYLHDSQMGILEGWGCPNNGNGNASEVLVEFTEFARNGVATGQPEAGYAHNMYISHCVAKFTLRYSYSHQVKEGHLVKTRARSNYIYANRITDDEPLDGTNQASALIDIPEGGPTYIIGNMFQKGTKPGNVLAALWYARERERVDGMRAYELYVVNNTYVSDTGTAQTSFILADFATTVFVANNITMGASNELITFEDTITRTVTATHNLMDTKVVAVTSAAGATVTNPPQVADAMLVNEAAFDWHLQPGSPAVDAGADPGSGDGYNLTPTTQYVATANAETRTAVGAPDIGAFELGNVGTPVSGDPPVAPSDPNNPSNPNDPTGSTSPSAPAAGSGSGTNAGITSTNVKSGCAAAPTGGWLAVLGALTLVYRRRRPL